MSILLNDAVNLISDTLALNENRDISPYFFIVGAGISMPEIPSSQKIVSLCKRAIKKRDESQYKQYLEQVGQYENNPMQHYSFWIGKAYPNKANRNKFFKDLIKKIKDFVWQLIACSNSLFPHDCNYCIYNEF